MQKTERWKYKYISVPNKDANFLFHQGIFDVLPATNENDLFNRNFPILFSVVVKFTWMDEIKFDSFT